MIDNTQDIYTAMSVLNTVKMYIDNKAIIAGGAPRDWYFDRRCSDIDIYVSTNRGSKELIDLLHTLYKADYTLLGKERHVPDISDTVGSGDNDAPYSDMPGMMYVVSFEVGGKTVQIINISVERRFQVIDDFDCSICRAYIKEFRFSNGILDKECIKLHHSFLETLDTQIVVFRDGLKNTKHLSKMKTRFKEYQFLSDKEYKLLRNAAKKLSFRKLSYLHREHSERFL